MSDVAGPGCTNRPDRLAADGRQDDRRPGPASNGAVLSGREVMRIAVLPGDGIGPEIVRGAGKRGMFEAGHGTALDIAGRNRANPIACIRAATLMLRHALSRPDLAKRVEAAVKQVLAASWRTADIHREGNRLARTTEIGDAVAAAVR